MPLTDAQAEAGKALAETTGKIVDLTKGIGSYLAETIGTIPQDLLGIAGGDWVHEKRRRDLAQMRARTERILEGIEKERISEPNPSVVMPLLEAAKDEGREELQELWAALLAQAMIDGGRKIRRAFFDVIQKLEPPDVFVLKTHYNRDHGYPSVDEAYASIGLSENDVRVSTNALVELGCFARVAPTNMVTLSSFGLALMEVTCDIPSVHPAPAPSPNTG